MGFGNVLKMFWFRRIVAPKMPAVLVYIMMTLFSHVLGLFIKKFKVKMRAC